MNIKNIMKSIGGNINYSCKLEYYYHNDKNRFNKELSKFIGYITRQCYQGFKQTSELYEEFKDTAIVWVYEKLMNNIYDSSKSRFDSYIYMQVRGELRKFFHRFNRENQHFDIDDCFDMSVSDDRIFIRFESFLKILEEINKEYNLNIDCKEYLFFILNSNNLTKSYLRNNYMLKFIAFEFLKRYFDDIRIYGRMISE